MPGVRAVEGLINERKIGDDIAFDGRFKERPLKPGWVAQMASLDYARRADPHPDENVASETLDERGAFT